MAPAFLRAFVPSRPQMPLQFLLHHPPRHHLQHRLEHIPVHLRLNRVHILGIVVPGHRFALLSRLTSTITKMRANDGHFCQPLIYRNFYTLSMMHVTWGVSCVWALRGSSPPAVRGRLPV